jgi:tetratricopeptide (TPR) repeat protein
MEITAQPVEIAEKAKKLYEAGQYSQAATAFEQAAHLYTASGDDLNAAEMFNNSSVAWLRAGNAQAAYDRAAQTDQVFHKANNQRLEGISLGNQAAALDALGKITDAIERYEQCAEILRQAGEIELLGYVLKSLSSLQVRQHKYFASMASMHEALSYQKTLTLKERILKTLLKLPTRLIR